MYETPQTARYLTQVQPRLASDLGTPVDPRLVAQPTEFPEAPSVIASTSQSNKKTNVCIPYTRVCRDGTNLSMVGSPVFVCARYEDTHRKTAASNMTTDLLAGLEAVNRELKLAAFSTTNKSADQVGALVATAEAVAKEWRLDGFLMNTQGEMEARPSSSFEPLRTPSSVLVAIQNPTTIRNIFCSRPMVGDRVYIGLVWSKTSDKKNEIIQWVPFSSQHLDMEHMPGQPVAPQLAYDGICNRHVTFPEEHRQGLCLAYCIGQIVDTAPSSGLITVNVQIRRMEKEALGIRHDEKHVVQTSQGVTTGLVKRNVVSYKYHGRLGFRRPDRSSCQPMDGFYLKSAEKCESYVAQQVMDVVETYKELAHERVSATLKRYKTAYGNDTSKVIATFGNHLTELSSLLEILRAGNEFKETSSELSKDMYEYLTGAIDNLDYDALSFAAFAAAGVACTFKLFQSPLRMLAHDERKAFEQFQFWLMLFWSQIQKSAYDGLEQDKRFHSPLKDVLRNVTIYDLNREAGVRTRANDSMGLLLKVSMVTEAVDTLLLSE